MKIRNCLILNEVDDESFLVLCITSWYLQEALQATTGLLLAALGVPSEMVGFVHELDLMPLLPVATASRLICLGYCQCSLYLSLML